MEQLALAELRRLGSGPSEAEEPRGLLIKVEAECDDPNAVLARAGEVLGAVLRTSSAGWPADEAWPSLLPAWFVERCAPEKAAAEYEAEMAEWRKLSHAEQVRWELEKPWSLLNWLHWFKPEERQWAWWDATTDSQFFVVEVVTQGEPLLWGNLQWLLRVAGARHVECLD